MKDEKDNELWQQAKARADFKTHLITYLIINSMLWLIWLLTSGIGAYPWPVWPACGWGIGLILNYIAVYKMRNTVEKEYDRLKKQNVH